MARMTLGLLVACAFHFVTVRTALALINVEYWTGSTWTAVSGSPRQPNTSFTISDSGGLTYRVWADDPASAVNGSIGTVTVSSQSGQTPTLFVGKGFTSPQEDQPLITAGAYSLAGIAYSGGNLDLQVLVNHDISGDAVATHVYRIDAGGTIAGNVEHNPGPISNPPRLGVIAAAQIGTGSGTVKSITAKYGDLFAVASSGPIYSDIESTNGSIGTVQTTGSAAPIASTKIRALNGSITDVIAGYYIGTGSGGESSVVIQAKNGIHLVQAGSVASNYTSFIRANIGADVGNTTSTTSGDITRLETGNSGSFYGSLAANHALGESSIPALTLAGDLNADIDIKQSFSNTMTIYGVFSSGHTISIGQDFASGGLINVQGNSPYGIQGQIIINASGGSYTWSQTAGIDRSTDPIFNPIFLYPRPSYYQLSSDIGGGAVGEAPFDFHQYDSQPTHLSSVSISQLPNPVVVRHYGPVVTVGSAPVQVFARVTGTTTWYEYTSDFKIIAGAGAGMRDVTIEERSTHTLGFAAGYDYKVVPVTNLQSSNALRCLQVDGKPAVRSYTYQFTITN